MQQINLIISGAPTTKQRQRFDPRTKRAYTPPSNIVSENDVRAVWREAGEPRIEDDVAIEIAVVIKVARPKGHYNSRGDLNAVGKRHPIPRNKKPDVDNCLKLIMDALNTRAYRDDVLVAKVTVERIWADWPSVNVTITPLHE